MFIWAYLGWNNLIPGDILLVGYTIHQIHSSTLKTDIFFGGKVIFQPPAHSLRFLGWKVGIYIVFLYPPFYGHFTRDNAGKPCDSGDLGVPQQYDNCICGGCPKKIWHTPSYGDVYGEHEWKWWWRFISHWCTLFSDKPKRSGSLPACQNTCHRFARMLQCKKATSCQLCLALGVNAVILRKLED